MFKKILISFLTFACQCFAHYDLSICAIFQDESPYLKEWIDYHLKVGVEHFYLYNNNSQDDYLKVLKPYIKSKVVELIEWPSYQEENDCEHFSFHVQIGAYNDAINRSKKKTKWLAIIDTDEFIVPVCDYKIVQVLEKYYSNASGVCVNWQCYGTSHVTRCNSGEMLENLTLKMKWNHDRNKHSKTIVQPLHVEYCNNPHCCVYKKGHWAIDTCYNKCESCPNGVYIEKIRINHYWSRDEWFLHNVKIPRYERWGVDRNATLELAEEMNEEYDPIILK